MKTIILILFIISFVVLVSCCKTLFPDKKLTLQRKDYTGNELKTDGYYYHFAQNATTVYFLYRNGIILCAYSYSSHDLDIVESEMIKLYPEIRNHKSGWGVFLVNDNQFLIEGWNASTGFSLPIIKRKGYIENDTTFRITESYFSDIDKAYQSDEIWHFKSFSPKPDSTNVYIK